MQPEHRSIRELAYQLWVARGRTSGSAERDWLEAERQLSSAPRAATPTGVDDALKDSYPASDPPATHLPDEPPANAEAKWEAAAAVDDSKRRAMSERSAQDAPPRPRASGRRDKTQDGPPGR